MIEREFIYRNYLCIIKLQPTGCRCGYVQIPKGDKYYGNTNKHLVDCLHCHGGITYNEGYLPGYSTQNCWFLGFDCAHFPMDRPDIEALKEHFGEQEVKYADELSKFYNENSHVWTVEEVEEELKNLVLEIAS